MHVHIRRPSNHVAFHVSLTLALTHSQFKVCCAVVLLSKVIVLFLVPHKQALISCRDDHTAHMKIMRESHGERVEWEK